MQKTPIRSETLAETLHALGATGQRGRAYALRRLLMWLTALALAISVLAASAAPVLAERSSDALAKALIAALVIGAIANQASAQDDPPRVEVRHPRIPASCAIEFESGGHSARPVTVYAERCLRREGITGRLPDCGRSVRIFGKRDRVYSTDCLRDAGFAVGRRRH